MVAVPRGRGCVSGVGAVRRCRSPCTSSVSVIYIKKTKNREKQRKTKKKKYITSKSLRALSDLIVVLVILRHHGRSTHYN